MNVAWASRAGYIGSLLGVMAGVACEPQDIYLFEERARVDAGRGNAGSAGATAEPPSPRTPPACESELCQACRDSTTTCPAASNLFCHPRTGECALGCDPEATEQGAVCPSSQVCHPVDGLCVDCVTSASCTAPGLGVCDTAQGKCVECTAAAGCEGARPVCDTEAQRCVECLGEQGCGPLDVCNDATQQCVECVTPNDCTADDDARFCFQSRCVECRVNADCTVELDRPICSDELECEDAD